MNWKSDTLNLYQVLNFLEHEWYTDDEHIIKEPPLPFSYHNWLIDPKYKWDKCIEIDLLDTVAAQKWLYILNENLKQCNEWKCYSNLIAQYTKVTASAHSKNVAYQKILAGIEGCNKHSEGEKFPYTPKPNMNWTETQLIHRAFTISMTTLKTYSHDLDVSQLMKLKFCDVKERHALMKKWTKRTFTIKYR